jgi:hypothetical protein
MNLESKLHDGRRIHTYDMPRVGLQEPAVIYETKHYPLNDQPVEIMDRYAFEEDARIGHWNWVFYLSNGAPLPADFPVRPY